MIRTINIENFASPELEWYRCRSEVQLLRAEEPDYGYFIAESPNVIRRAGKAGYEPISFLTDFSEFEKEKELFDHFTEVPVYIAAKEVLEQIPGFQLTRGTMALMRSEYSNA